MARMSDRGLTLFDTPIGRCGLAWGPRGLLAVQLPEGGDDALRARLLRRCPDAAPADPPPEAAAAVAAIVGLLSGARDDLQALRLDMAGIPGFDRRVYAAARAIPPGHTLTYGALAARVGDPGAARAVGQALGRNPFAPVVPCHRVLAAGRALGGFSAIGGTATKRRMLEIEGAALPPAQLSLL
jgi:methylated-DNA-[protein]-cysteine S-methyltransferase